MASSPASLGAPAAPLRVIDPLPDAALVVGHQRIKALTGLGLSGAILLATVVAMGGLDTARFAAVALDARFWLCFAAAYALGPVSEWLILRRAWHLRADALPALFQKQAANEILFGYSGDAQFYLWARQHQSLKGSVFGTLRDVTTLSSLAGDLVTLTLMIVTAPLVYTIAGGMLLDLFVIAIAVIILASLALAALRRVVALFTLSSTDLGIALALQCLRILIGLSLVATLWKLMLPELDLATLLAAATLRMMAYRVPLVPAREVLVAPLLLALIGPASGLPAAAMLIAVLSLAAHLLATAATSLSLKHSAR